MYHFNNQDRSEKDVWRRFKRVRERRLQQLLAKRLLLEGLESRLMLAIDFGDAPDTALGTGTGNYNTLSTDGGPSHTIVSGLFMGATVDSELEALPNADANGDDFDQLLDDEDGLSDPLSDLSLTIGSQPKVDVVVTNTTGSAATLYGWIDSNADGVFDNATERATVLVADGTASGIVTLEFAAVPLGFTGTTYARFRLSTDVAAANPTGAASDGEVEDYAATIDTQFLSITATDANKAEGDAGTTAFTFTVERTAPAYQIYWADSDIGGINQANPDGTNVQTALALPAPQDPAGLALDLANGKMYWSDGGVDRIRRANLDGTNIEELVETGLSIPLGIALDVANGKMYWTDIGTHIIRRANLDGTDIEDLVTTGIDRPFGIAIDSLGGKMYWADESGSARKIQRANLDGTNVQDLVTTGNWGPRYVALDISADKIYWTDGGPVSRILRANLDGSDVEVLVEQLRLPNGIALDIDAGKMYWIDEGSDKLQQANLDGTNVKDLVITGLSNPLMIALATNASTATTVDYTITGSGSVPADADDFGASLPSGQLTLDAGESTKVLTVNVQGDTQFEGDESFHITLSNAGAGTIAVHTAEGLIINDDCTTDVTTTTDGGSGSLRNAIICANLTPGPDIISLTPGIYSLSVPGASENAAATGDLDITDELAIVGSGASNTIIDAGGPGGLEDRVFQVHASAGSVSISGVTIRGGNTTVQPETGGGIRSELGSNLTLLNSTITENTSINDGGGIHNWGTLTLEDSIVSSNTAGFSGGGMQSNGGASILRTTFLGNTAQSEAGAINIPGGPPVSVQDSSFISNQAVTGGGGAVINQGTIDIVGSTFSDNIAKTWAGGLLLGGSSTISTRSRNLN